MNFAIRIVHLYQYLTESKREYVLSKQLLRSGTSIGANTREANNAQSTNDFIHKLSLAQKECDESLYWLELLYRSNILTEQEFKSIHGDCEEIYRIVTKSIITSKGKNKAKIALLILIGICSICLL